MTFGLRRPGAQRVNNRKLGEVLGGVGVSTMGNTAGTTGTVFGPVALVGLSGVTLSQRTNGNAATISIIASAEAGVAISAGTTIAQTGTVVFSNANNVTFGLNGQTLTASAAGGPSIAAGTGTAAVTQATGTVFFGSGNGVTFGLTNGTLTASVAAQSVQPAIVASAGTQLASSGTLVFSNSNGLTFGISNSSVLTASVSREPSISAGTQLGSSGTIVFAVSNGITFGMSGSSQVTASHNAVSEVGIQDSAGIGVNQGLPRLIFATSAGANVSFGKSVNAGTISITAAVAAVNVAGGTQTGTSGTVVFSNSNNVSFGLSNSSIMTATVATPDFAAGSQTMSVANGTLVFANSNNVTFGMSASSQITASVGTISVSAFEAYPQADLNATTLGDVQLFLQRMQLPFNLAATRAVMIIDVSNSSSAGGSLTVRFGVYTMSGSTASLASSASRTWGYNSTAAASSYTAQSGWRYRSISLGTWNLTPGDYFFGAVVSINTSGTSGTYSWKARRNLPLDVSEFGGAATYPYFFFGSYSAITGNLPASIQVSEVMQASGGGAADENDGPWWALFGTN